MRKTIKETTGSKTKEKETFKSKNETKSQDQ